MNRNETKRACRRICQYRLPGWPADHNRRKSELKVNLKFDGSPVTAADVQAERIIRARLAGIMPDVAIKRK